MISWYDRNKKKREKSWDKIYNQFGFLDRIFLVLTLWTKQVVLKNMEVENITIPGPKLRPILLLKSMEAENIFLTLWFNRRIKIRWKVLIMILLTTEI